jgi:glycine cleavage system regulatory protein
MDGGVLFKARATLFVPAHAKLSTVRADLEKIASDLMVDLKVGSVEK